MAIFHEHSLPLFLVLLRQDHRGREIIPRGQLALFCTAALCGKTSDTLKLHVLVYKSVVGVSGKGGIPEMGYSGTGAENEVGIPGAGVGQGKLEVWHDYT